MKLLLSKVLLVSCLGALPLTGGCAPETLKWEEEVKLHDDKIIVVQRKQELTGTGMPVQKRGFNKYFQFCYTPMHIVWKSKPSYFPETFDIVEGKAYAKVSIGGMQCMLHDYPKTNALYFRWDGKAWQEISYEDYPKGLRYNMLGGVNDWNPERDARGLITIADKEKRDAEMYYIMRKLPNVTGLNDGPSDAGRCEKEKSIHSKTDQTPDVFLPVTEQDCN